MNTRSESLKKAWRNRKGYIGPDKKSSLYTTWRARVFTLKGKMDGFPESWDTFRGFKDEMFEGWVEGKILARKDTQKSFSKENCEWVDKGMESFGKLKTLGYNGETKTLLEWCQIYDLNYTGVRQRYFRGNDYTPEQILFGKRHVKRGTVQDHLLLDHQKRNNKISRMLSAYRLRDKKKNIVSSLPREFFENQIISKPCVYCGSLENVGCDRIDNSKGHTIENVIPACYTCNTVRNSNFTVKEMKLLGKVITEIREQWEHV